MNIETRKTPAGWMAKRDGELYGPFASEDDMHAANHKAAHWHSLHAAGFGSAPRRRTKRTPTESAMERDSKRNWERRQAELQQIWDSACETSAHATPSKWTLYKTAVWRPTGEFVELVAVRLSEAGKVEGYTIRRPGFTIVFDVPLRQLTDFVL